MVELTDVETLFNFTTHDLGGEAEIFAVEWGELDGTKVPLSAIDLGEVERMSDVVVVLRDVPRPFVTDGLLSGAVGRVDETTNFAGSCNGWASDWSDELARRLGYRGRRRPDAELARCTRHRGRADLPRR